MECATGPGGSVRMVLETIRDAVMPLLLNLLEVAGCRPGSRIFAHMTVGDADPRRPFAFVDAVHAGSRNNACSLTGHLTLPGDDWLLVVLTSLTLSALAFAWWKRRPKADGLEHAAFALITFGALANIASRVIPDAMATFLDLASWPAFNVADILVCAGAFLMGVRLTRERVASLAALAR